MMQAYLDGKREASYIGTLVSLMIFCFAVLGFCIAYGVFFGWIPLGERANILRSNLNPFEYIIAVAGLIYGLGCARTAYGLMNREQASLRWSQWMYFVTVIIGGAILLSVVIPVGLKFALLLGQEKDLRALINDDIGGMAPIALAIGESLISISVLVAGLVALLSLLVFLIPPLEQLREDRWRSLDCCAAGEVRAGDTAGVFRRHRRHTCRRDICRPAFPRLHHHPRCGNSSNRRRAALSSSRSVRLYAGAEGGGAV